MDGYKNYLSQYFVQNPRKFYSYRIMVLPVKWGIFYSIIFTGHINICKLGAVNEYGVTACVVGAGAVTVQLVFSKKKAN